jgi:NAD(P)-dependent dehydrogenase (short-subunit alcohol dehydrogenase family)
MPLAVVTGSNRGIGLELCRALKARGYQLIAACRKPSPELEALGVEMVTDIDVASDAGVKKLASAVGSRSIELLINNAGILAHEELGKLDFDSVSKQFAVNALGPLRVTAALAPRLARGAKVALVTSRMGSIADNTSGGYYGYRMSKAALNMAGASLAHDLRAQGVAVVLLHPGYVRTAMTGNGGGIEPKEAAAGLLARIDALTLATSGRFWHQSGEELPW